MEKIIKIGKQSVKLSNNVAWTMEYRDQFGKDPLEAILPLVTAAIEATSSIINESGTGEIGLTDIASALEGRAFDITLPLMQLGFVDTVVNVTWAMAKAADESIAPPKQWVKQFDDFHVDVIVPAVGDMLLKGFSSSKNLKRLRSLLGSLKTNQPSTLTPSSSQDLNEG